MSWKQRTATLAVCLLPLAASAQLDRWAACPKPLEFKCRGDPTCSLVPCSTRAENILRQARPPSLQEQLRRKEKNPTSCAPGMFGRGGDYNSATHNCKFGLVSPKTAASAAPGKLELRAPPTHDCPKGPLGEGGQYRIFGQTCNQGRIEDLIPDKK